MFACFNSDASGRCGSALDNMEIWIRSAERARIGYFHPPRRPTITPPTLFIGKQQFMASIGLKNVVKKYDNGHVAVNDANLEIADGEFMVLVGPSGCGKSTTLRMIAGLEAITAGDIMIGDRRVNDVQPGDRDIAMVFQNYALYPHMTVRDNLSFGLRTRKMAKSEIEARITRAAEILSIHALLDRQPAEMSGGERQRIALGRAIVRQPAAFLFDEPLSNLDAKLRVQMRIELARLHQTLGTTTVYVTHDQVEAMTLGDRITVMNNGVIQQVDTPLNLYHQPANHFVAGFLGSPAMNFLSGAVDQNRFQSGDLRYALSREVADLANCTLGFRPEELSRDSQHPALGKATVEVVERMGHETIVYFQMGGHSTVGRFAGNDQISAGDSLVLYLPADKWHVFAADGDQLRVASG